MVRHLRPAPSTYPEKVCEEISDWVADLVDPTTTRSTQWVLADDGRRLVSRSRSVEHPCLLVQLGQATGASTAGVSSSGFESQPPGSLDAADALRTIRKQSSWWVRSMFNARPGLLPADLLMIASRSHELAVSDLRFLRRDVQAWWTEARIATAWESPPLKPHVACMVCGKVGTLRVVLEPMAAQCRHCRATWDASTIGILGEHIRLATSEPIVMPAADLEATARHADDSGTLTVVGDQA